MAAYTSYARAIPEAAARIRANLRAPLSRPLLESGRVGVPRVCGLLRERRPRVFAGVTDATKQNELRDANGAAVAAMRDLASWLESQRSSATGSYALGAERFARMLRMTEGVTTPLAELEAAGRADLDTQSEALREACAQYAPGAAIPACIARMNANKPQGGAVGGRAGTARRAEGVREGRRRGHDPRHRGGARRRGAAVQSRQLRVHRHPWSVRKGTAGDVLHRAAGSVMDAPPSSATTCRVRPTCCSRRSTRSGRGISCSSCTRTAIRRSSDGCSSVTPLPKGGPTTRKR